LGEIQTIHLTYEQTEVQSAMYSLPSQMGVNSKYWEVSNGETDNRDCNENSGQL